MFKDQRRESQHIMGFLPRYADHSCRDMPCSIYCIRHTTKISYISVNLSGITMMIWNSSSPHLFIYWVQNPKELVKYILCFGQILSMKASNQMHQQTLDSASHSKVRLVYDWMYQRFESQQSGNEEEIDGLLSTPRSAKCNNPTRTSAALATTTATHTGTGTLSGDAKCGAS